MFIIRFCCTYMCLEWGCQIFKNLFQKYFKMCENHLGMCWCSWGLVSSDIADWLEISDHLILPQGFCFEKSIISSFFGNVELFWLLILKIIKDIFGFCIMHFEMTLNFAFYNIRTVYIYLSVLIFLIQVLYLYYFVDMCISKIPV